MTGPECLPEASFTLACAGLPEGAQPNDATGRIDVG